MTLTQLRTLLAVADAGSVRGASERLVISQPAVSGVLAGLERELRVTLVERSGRGLRFTSAGMAFVASARAALALIDHAVRTARSAAEPEEGSVHIAAVTTAAERVLPALLAEFHRCHPHVSVMVRSGNRTAVWDAVREGDADLAVGGRPPENLRAQVLGRADNHLVLIGPAPWAAPLFCGPRSEGGSAAAILAAARACPDALGAITWLLRERGSGTRDVADTLLTQLGLSPPTITLGSNGAVEQAAIAGLGVGLLPRHAVAASLATGQLAVYQCRGTPLLRPWHLVARPSLTPTALLAAWSMLTAASGFVPTAAGRRLLREGVPVG